MPTPDHHQTLFHDTITTLIAAVFGIAAWFYEGAGPFIDREGQRIIAVLTILTLSLLAVRHWKAIISNRP